MGGCRCSVCQRAPSSGRPVCDRDNCPSRIHRVPSPALVTHDDVATEIWQMRVDVVGYSGKPTETAMINRGGAEKIAAAILSKYHLTLREDT